ncbi:MAG: type 4a pilus biogenesis protein PilO [Terriglobia bacterium]
MDSKKLINLTPAQQVWLLTLLPAIVAIVVFYDFVMPVRRRAVSLEIQYQALQAQNLRGTMLMARQADLLKRIALAHQQLQQLRQIIPDQPADDNFVKTIYGAAASSAVHIRSLVAKTSANEEYFTATPFQLHADGTYYRMLNFFIRLANSPRIVDVSNLSLGSPGAHGGGGAYAIGPEETVAADCLLTTYYTGSQAPAAKNKKARRR